jgi:acyl-CoA thioesterase YciA
MQKNSKERINMDLVSSQICKTGDIGIYNNLFGGKMLAWLDEAGGTYSASVCCTPYMITLKMDEVVFKKPVKVNDHIRIYGEVSRMGKSSLAINLEARRFNFAAHSEELVCTTSITFVRIDEYGQAVPIAEDIRKKYEHLQS